MEQHQLTTIGEISDAAAAGADPKTLYDAVFGNLLERLATADAEERKRLAATRPDNVDQPWAAAIVGTVEHAAITFGFETPAWCDEPNARLTATAIGGQTHEEWSEALHGAHAAFVRQEVFPDPATIARATGGRTPALRGTRGPREADWAIDEATAIEKRLGAEGLRGHVYIHMSAATWFCTRTQSPRRIMGQSPFAAAIRETVSSEGPGRWIARLAKAIGQDQLLSASVWWDTPHLVVTGCWTRVALAAALGTADDENEEALEQLLWNPDVGRSVAAADRAVRLATGRPTSTAARRRVAAITGEELKPSRKRWLAEWMKRAGEAAKRNELEGLVRRAAPREARWPRRNETSCGDLEAELRTAGAGNTEQGRLWIDTGTGGRAARLLLLDAQDPSSLWRKSRIRLGPGAIEPVH